MCCRYIVRHTEADHSTHTESIPAKRCLGEGMEMQHRMAEAFFTASSKKGDSAAALTASEARCISDWPGPICTVAQQLR